MDGDNELGEGTMVEAAGAMHGTESGDGDVMNLLAGRVPLTLLMDLAMPAGPHSSELLTTEGLPEHPWWERA